MLTQQEITKHCPNCATVLEEKNDHKECPNCGKHYYFNARPCVAIWLSNSKGEILLTKRANDPFKDWWDIPGGFVEEHETLEEAILRELREETGLEASGLRYLGSVYEDYPFGNEIVPIVAAVFEGIITGNEEVAVADDVSDYKFLPKSEIDIERIAFDNQRAFLSKLI